MEFKDRLRKLRTESGMTQEELAQRLGITKPAVSAYERGTNKPRFDALDNLAEIFDVDINYLLGNTDQRTPYPKHYIAQEDTPAHENYADYDRMFEHGHFFVETPDQRSINWKVPKEDGGYQQIEVTPQEYRLVMALRLMSPSKRDAVYSEILSK